MLRYALIVAINIIPLVPGTAVAEPKSITSEAAFRSAVVDKTLALGSDRIVINSAGQMTGVIGGAPITASKWEWRGNRFCRVVKTSARDFPSDCQTVKVDGNAVMFPTSTWIIQ